MFKASNATHDIVHDVSGFDAIYFNAGVHDIGVFKVPSNVKQIHLPQNAWVYGAFVMDGKDRSDVKIFGRGVLSGARLHLRESHSIEAVNSASNITVSGITIADYVHFAIRLLGKENLVEWTKVVGGWIYNCDGIAAYGGSKKRNWNAKKAMSKGLKNKLIGVNEKSKIDRFLFSNFFINGVCINSENVDEYFEIRNADNIRFDCD